MGKPKITKKKLKDYLQDSKNFNKGNEYGESLIAKSISKFGAGRSMLAASDGTLIAGNKSHQKLAEAGIENVIEVETDGKTAVVVKRTDIKSGSKQFHEMALADNATSKANLTFDEILVEEVLGEEIMNEFGIYSAEGINRNEEWKGMPEFEIMQDALKIVISFKDEKARQKFVKKFPIDFLKKESKTWMTWWPFRERDDNKSLKYESA